MQTNEILDGIFERQRMLGLSNQQLADGSAVPKSTIERIKRGETLNPSMQTVLDLAGAVGYQFGPAVLEKPDTSEDVKYLEKVVRTQEDQIARLRAHYTMLLAEKNRWITYLFRLCLALVGFIIIMLVLDALTTDRGWIQTFTAYRDSFAGIPNPIDTIGCLFSNVCSV